MYYLSFLMAADNIQDKQLEDLGIEIVEKDSDGDRKLKIPKENVANYIRLVKNGLNPGFWNEVVGPKDIYFIFKFKDGTIKEDRLTPTNEKEIAQLCTQFNKDPIEKTSNVYKYISGNGFYRKFMLEHYKDLIKR